MTAVIALVAGTLGYLVVLGNSVADWTMNAVRIAIILKPLKAGVIVRKLFFKIKLRILCAHFSHLYTKSIAQNIRGVKGYLP